jgi:hypothetical protein
MASASHHPIALNAVLGIPQSIAHAVEWAHLGDNLTTLTL